MSTCQLLERSHGSVTLVEGIDGPVRFGFTERTGGVSREPFASLDLGSHVGDDPAAVGENRRRALAALGASSAASNLIAPRQVHGDRVVTVAGSSAAAIARARDEASAGADAIVCTVPGVPVLLCFADCVPVVLTCGDAFAVAHSGWKGTIARIASKAALCLSDAAGLPVSDVRAYLGPHILGDEYEVSSELMARFAASFRAVRPAVSAGSRMLDLSACIFEALSEVGVPRANMADPGLSTVRGNDRFFSYRLENGRCGRHAAIAIMDAGRWHI